MRKYELDGRVIKISQALELDERFDKQRLGYIKYAINKSTGIELYWIELNVSKKSISVKGHLVARIENNGFLKYYKYEDVEDEVDQGKPHETCWNKVKQVRLLHEDALLDGGKPLSNQDNVKEKGDSQLTTSESKSWQKGDSARYHGQKNHVRGSGNRRGQKTGWRQRGQRSASTARSSLREITDCVTDFAFSIWSSLLRGPMQVAHGLSRKKHEKMIKTAQRKMLRLMIQTKRKYKKSKEGEMDFLETGWDYQYRTGI